MGDTLLRWSPGTLYLEFLSNVSRLGFSLAAMCWLTDADSRELILRIPSRAEPSGSCASSFKSATVGIFTPWKLANATNQGLGFFVAVVFPLCPPPAPENQFVSTPHCLFIFTPLSLYSSQSLPLPERHLSAHLATGEHHHIQCTLRSLSPCLSPSVDSHQKARST